MTDLFYHNDLVWDKLSAEEKAGARHLADAYLEFLNLAKTERLAVKYAVQHAEAHGFKPASEFSEFHSGDKVYFTNRKKNLLLAIIGEESLMQESHLVAAHLDSPRLDLKANPLYQDEDMVLLKTHYYGGVKKYQWVNIPLEMHGVIAKQDGTLVEVHIGADPADPIFVISDVLPHLGGKIQGDRKAGEVIKGEELNVLAGGLPAETTKIQERTKLKFLQLLNEKYAITEEDFLSAELSLVPSFQPRYVGLDKGLIGAYGQDDRICSFTSLYAILAASPSKYTSLCYLVDKEEIGSEGNTGALSQWLVNVMSELLVKQGSSGYHDLLTAMSSMKVLSSDVNVAVNPTFASINDPPNAGHMGKGVILTKFSGARGKSGSNDAHAEFLGYMRKIFATANVQWQIGEWGKVDEGGAGTIAKFLARYNAEVVDLGPGLLGMHSTYEISHIADLLMTYRAYAAFFQYNE